MQESNDPLDLSHTWRCWATGCERRSAGGPMQGLATPTGEPVYSCEMHFLMLRKRTDLQKRRMKREVSRTNKQ